MAWTAPAGPQESCVPMHLKKKLVRKARNALFLNNTTSTTVCAVLAGLAAAIALTSYISQYIDPSIWTAMAAAAPLAALLLVALLHRASWPQFFQLHSLKKGASNSSDGDLSYLLAPEDLQNEQAQIINNERSSETQNQTQASPRQSQASTKSHLGDNANSHAQLMACMSHEFRTPLNAVIGFTDVMQKELFGPLGSPRYQEYVQHIKECGSALLKSTEDTLAMTTALTEQGAQCINREVVPLHLSARKAWASLNPAKKPARAKLELDVNPDLQVLMDGATLRQILLNLFSEALAHLGPSQVVCVSASVDQELVQIEVSAKEPANDTTRNTTSPIENTANSLSLCLARTLLELQGLSLLVIPESNGAWRAITIIDRATQQDFFDEAETMTSHANARLTTSQTLEHQATS